MEPPEPPEGYSDGYKYESNAVAQLLSFIFLVSIALIVFQSSLEDTQAIIQEFGRSGAGVVLLLLIIVYIVNTEVHERIHRQTGLFFGYDPEIYRRWYFKPHVKSTDQWIENRHNIIELLAPLFIINSISSAVVLVDVHLLLTYVGSMSVAINTATSFGDVAGAWYSLNLPDETLVYFPETKERIGFVYEPNTE
jgi:uncharacterized membrane protein